MAANISPQLSRKLQEKASRLLCQQCWVPLILVERKGQPKPHPCLFCEKCLKKCGAQPKYGEQSWRSCNFMLNTKQKGTKLSTWKPADKEAIFHKKEYGNVFLSGTFSRRSGLTTETSVDSGEDGHMSVLKNTAFKEKLRQFDKTATRCGFCPRDSKRRKLVRFCFHCHKHLCGSCSSKHSAEKLYRYHATVDLTNTAKQGLQ